MFLVPAAYFSRTKKSLPIYEQRIFHESFQSSRCINSDADERPEDQDDIDDIICEKGYDTKDESDEVVAPASPGMEHLLNEQMEAKKKASQECKIQ